MHPWTGTTVGWLHHDGVDWEVRLATKEAVYSAWSYNSVTNNTINDQFTDVHNGAATWFDYSGASDVHIYLATDDYPAGAAFNVSNSPYDDRYPRMGTSGVVWQGRDSAGDWEIFVAQPDLEPPVTEIFSPADGAFLSVSPAVISGQATDNIGVTLVQVSIDASGWQEAVIDSGAGTPWATWHYDWSLPLEDGSPGHSICARAFDYSGNARTSALIPTVYVDRVSPVISSFQIDNGAAQTDSTTVTLTNTVTDGSPLMRTRFSNDGATWSAWEPYAATKSWTLTSGLGMKTVWCSFEDVHGHVAGDGLVSDTIELVSTLPPPTNHPPVVDAGPDRTVTTDMLFVLSATFTDADSSDTHTAVACTGSVTVDLIVTEPTGGTPGKGTEMIRLSEPETYSITFTVTDDKGGVGSDTMVVTVTAPPWLTAFADVPSGADYYDAIYGMRDAGIIDGYGDGRFGPTDSVRRQQFAKIIVGAMSVPPHPTTTTRFTDLGAPDALGYPHIFVQAAWENGITRGVNASQTLYAPYANITRAQVVTMVVRALDNLLPGTLAAPLPVAGAPAVTSAPITPPLWPRPSTTGFSPVWWVSAPLGTPGKTPAEEKWRSCYGTRRLFLPPLRHG